MDLKAYTYDISTELEIERFLRKISTGLEYFIQGIEISDERTRSALNFSQQQKYKKIIGTS